MKIQKIQALLKESQERTKIKRVSKQNKQSTTHYNPTEIDDR
jgi:hypothetical protein